MVPVPEVNLRSRNRKHDWHLRHIVNMSTIRIGSVLTFWLSIVCCRSFVPQKARCRSFIIGAIVDMNSPDQTNEWNVPKNGFSGKIWEERPKAHLTTSSNATLPIAMMVLDPSLFPSRSMAIRAIRCVS